mmetsp:Transcript_639/g.815  ORF Transcript_639/g.815 Transcript_639/m.815 type:complete len:134 (-) Transcript_639:140-541(-)
MPRYFCDYCNVYLTHDSAPGRKQHIRGWKHRENVKQYYEVYMKTFYDKLGPRPPILPGLPPPGSIPPPGSVPLPRNSIPRPPGSVPPPPGMPPPPRGFVGATPFPPRLPPPPGHTGLPSPLSRPSNMIPPPSG